MTAARDPGRGNGIVLFDIVSCGKGVALAVSLLLKMPQDSFFDISLD
jgi:hypothetical protein